MKLLIVNGPNLNLLGKREPTIYGDQTYQDLESYIGNLSKELAFTYQIIQSNYEGKIIDSIQQAPENGFNAILINPAAFTHYSYAIYDAILAVGLPTVEVHLSDIKNREIFRQTSVITPACLTSFMGEHFLSYRKGIEYLKRYLHE